MPIKYYTILLGVIIFSCSKDNAMNQQPKDNSPVEPSEREFKMGFTSWSFGPNLEDVDQTYSFIVDNADIYAEHIDNKIPWNAWMNDLSLPTEFTNDISGKANRKISDHELLLSISLLNSNRDELAEDFDGSIPSYQNLNDIEIEDAYFNHVNYLVNQFSPNYLVISIEANELRLRAENKWDAYKLLIENVKSRIKEDFPDLLISESISLHNLYQVDTPNQNAYENEVISYMNQMDFVTISFYPFFKNQHTQTEFQQAFDFLHSNISRPIAFVETSHLAEDLIVSNLNLSITGNENEQNIYLETLIANAEKHNYEFIIWWAHRDFDALWEVFPVDLKDLGQIWRDTGLLDENGNERLAKRTWSNYLNQ